MEFTALHPALGARVDGLDIKNALRTNAITPELVLELREMWGRSNGVLVFKQQHLSTEELKAFTAHFGHVLQHPFINASSKSNLYAQVNEMVRPAARLCIARIAGLPSTTRPSRATPPPMHTPLPPPAHRDTMTTRRRVRARS